MSTLQHLFDQARIRTMLVFGARNAAMNLLGDMLARNPKDAYALNTRAQLHLQSKHAALAIADMRAACDATPDTALNASHVWYNLGYLLNEQKEVEQAEAAFRKSLAINPKLDLSWYGLGLVLIQQRRFDEAADSLKQNTKLQPMSPYGWYQLARVHMDRKAPEEAARVIRHLRGFEPKVADQLVRETGVGA